MFAGVSGSAQPIALTLFTDAFLVRGSLLTRHRRVTDMLNDRDATFLVLSDVTTDEFGTRGETVKAAYAQINLESVLFAVADNIVEPIAELRTPKRPELARIVIPPFKVIGNVHVLPVEDLREGLGELVGRFIPVTEATYWSDALGEARQTSQLVAVNHGRAQILAPYQEVDPWAGLGAPGAADADARPTGSASGDTPSGEPPPADLGW